MRSGEAVVARDHCRHRLDVRSLQVGRPLQRLRQLRSIRLPSPLQGVDQRQRYLSLPEIAAHRFSHGLRVAGVVQDIVDDLERHADARAVPRQSLRLFQGGPAQQRADAAAGCHQQRRLRLDNLEVGIDVQIDLRAHADLEHLALAHAADRIAQQPE